MYREDKNKGHRFLFCKVLFNHAIKVIGRGPRTTTGNLVIFARVDKTKKSKSAVKCFQQQSNRLIWKPVLQKGTSSRCVLFIRKLTKHDHLIYCAKLQERQINLPVNKLFRTFTHSKKAETLSYERMLISKSHRPYLSLFSVFFFSWRNILLFSEKSQTKGHTPE